MTKEFNNKYIEERYETGDIVSYENLCSALGDGYGDPGNVQIATLDHIGWYPAGFCSRADNGVWDCSETKVFPENEYGKTWVGVCSTNIDGWAAADAGIAFLLDNVTLDQNKQKEGGEKKMKYYVTGEDHYEPGEIEEEFDNLDDAQTCSGRIIDDGGYAEVTDENGNEYPAYPW